MRQVSTSKHKYIYNPNTLNYERITLTTKDRLKRLLSFVITGMVFASIILFVAYTFFDSPKEIALKRENEQLKLQYAVINKDVSQIKDVLSNIIHRDNNIYRVIFEAEPISQDVREAGVGGVNRYIGLEGYKFSELVINTRKTIDNISQKLYIQSKSFDEIVELAKQKEELLQSIPAIQPITNEDLTRVASGFGYRIHPIHKIRKMHTGMDFTAPRGTPIYATGDGKIIQADAKNRGYGNHVRIDHGYGYVTLYAHMSKFNCRVGQKVKRGDVIGYVGNTGKSVGPHCHYEVRKNGNPINPVNFYFNDLTPEQYAKMLELANDPTQSLD